MWTFLEHPNYWAGATSMLHAENIPDAFWKRRNDLPYAPPHVEPEDAERLADALAWLVPELKAHKPPKFGISRASLRAVAVGATGVEENSRPPDVSFVEDASEGGMPIADPVDRLALYRPSSTGRLVVPTPRSVGYQRQHPPAPRNRDPHGFEWLQLLEVVPCVLAQPMGQEGLTRKAVELVLAGDVRPCACVLTATAATITLYSSA